MFLSCEEIPLFLIKRNEDRQWPLRAELMILSERRILQKYLVKGYLVKRYLVKRYLSILQPLKKVMNDGSFASHFKFWSEWIKMNGSIWKWELQDDKFNLHSSVSLFCSWLKKKPQISRFFSEWSNPLCSTNKVCWALRLFPFAESQGQRKKKKKVTDFPKGPTPVTISPQCQEI